MFAVESVDSLEIIFDKDFWRVPFAWSLESMGLALPLFHVEYGIQQETEREYICCQYVAIRDFDGSVWSGIQSFGLIEFHPIGSMPEVCRPTMCDGWCRKRMFFPPEVDIKKRKNFEIRSNPSYLMDRITRSNQIPHDWIEIVRDYFCS